MREKHRRRRRLAPKHALGFSHGATTWFRGLIAKAILVRMVNCVGRFDMAIHGVMLGSSRLRFAASAALLAVALIAPMVPCPAQDVAKPAAPEAPASTASKPATPEPPADNAARQLVDILKIETERADRAADLEEHFLQFSVDRLIWLVSVVAGLMVGVGAVISWAVSQFARSYVRASVNEFRQNVQQRLQATIDSEIEVSRQNIEKLLRAEFDTEISAIRERADRAITDAVTNAAAIADLRPAQTAGTSPPTTAAQPTSQPRKVIVWVDDRPQTIEPVKAELERRGIEVEIATSTEALDQKLREHSYDLIVSDMRRGSNRREGLDYFISIKDRNNLPSRFIYTGSRNITSYNEEFDRLRAESPKFLGVATTPSDFFAMVLEGLAR